MATTDFVITITIPCRADIPEHVQQWMRDSIAAHATEEFGRQFDPDWVTPRWAGRPLLKGAEATVTGGVRQAGDR
jgi:hypothetical protein